VYRYHLHAPSYRTNVPSPAELYTTTSRAWHFLV
jgi:hypothetical protein